MGSKVDPAQDDISVVVQTGRGTDTFSFGKTTKVSEVIVHVRTHFELTGEGTFMLVRKSDNSTLSPVERPLVSFGLEEGETLVLTGGGRNV